MIGQRNSIQPPPSVEELLGAGPEARLGQVDFATRLTAEQQQEEAAAPAAAPARPARRPRRPCGAAPSRPG